MHRLTGTLAAGLFTWARPPRITSSRRGTTSLPMAYLTGHGRSRIVLPDRESDWGDANKGGSGRKGPA